jgi:glycosyltransferase involved in cell wall biosynthesis
LHSASKEPKNLKLIKSTILIIIDHYLPGIRAGGPIRTTTNLIDWLGDDFHFRVMTKDRDLGDEVPYGDIIQGSWNIVGKAKVRYLSPSEMSPHVILRLLLETPHDVIYLNSVFSTRTVIVLVLSRLGRIGAPIVLATRGNLSSSALKLKSFKKQIFLLIARLLNLYKHVIWHSTSEEETRDIRRVFGTTAARSVRQISNLPSPIQVDVPFRVSKNSGECRLVMIARITRMKNLEFAAEVLHYVRGNVRLEIWGPIEDQAYWYTCQQRFAALPKNITICHMGVVSPDCVHDVFRQYDAFFMPTLGENFGHAILEALSAGCPVLISDRTPWNDVNESGAGWALPLDQLERFRETIEILVNADTETLNAYRQCALNYARAYLSRSTAVDDMRAFLNEVVNSGHHT